MEEEREHDVKEAREQVVKEARQGTRGKAESSEPHGEPEATRGGPHGQASDKRGSWHRTGHKGNLKEASHPVKRTREEEGGTKARRPQPKLHPPSPAHQ